MALDVNGVGEYAVTCKELFEACGVFEVLVILVVASSEVFES